MTAAPHPEPVSLGDALLRPVHGHHAFEACVEQLGTAIRLGVYPRDSTLPPERELAERMKVSRATLREAMAALREAGLVQTRRGRGGGTVVTLKPTFPTRGSARRTASRREEWLDALEFRRLVEPGAAQLAASTALSDASRRALDRAQRERRISRHAHPVYAVHQFLARSAAQIGLPRADFRHHRQFRRGILDSLLLEHRAQPRCDYHAARDVQARRPAAEGGWSSWSKRR